MRLLILLLTILGLSAAHGHGHHGQNNKSAKMFATNFFHALDNAAETRNQALLEKLVLSEDTILALLGYAGGITHKVLNASFQKYVTTTIEATVFVKYSDMTKPTIRVYELQNGLTSPTGWVMVGEVEKAYISPSLK